MNQIIEKPNKNEWGLADAASVKPALHWKDSTEYRKTAEFFRHSYGPFGRVVFTGLGVMALAAIGIWGISFWAEALELIIGAIRNMPNAGGVGAAIGSVAGALFAACWKAAVGAVILFPVWHGLKKSHQKFLRLLSAEQSARQPQPPSAEQPR